MDELGLEQTVVYGMEIEVIETAGRRIALYYG